MGKRFLLSETEIADIRSMYGLLSENVTDTPTCSSSGCYGTYRGPQFVRKSDGSCDDVAHQYSNVMMWAVSKKLKELYKAGNYSKVDLDNIKMTTTDVTYGCNTKYTEYFIDIPFVQVKNPCDARTGFNHVGGWGHKGAGINLRKAQIYNDTKQDPNNPKNRIRTNPVVGTIDDFDYKEHSTPEGLTEIWIQFKHSDYQSKCVLNTSTVPNQTTNLPPKKSSQQSDSIITLKSDSLKDLREKLNTDTKNISIDPKSVKTNFFPGNYNISFQSGSTKIEKISLLFDDISQKNMDDRYSQISKQKHVTLLEKGEVKSSNGKKLWYVLSLVLKQ